MGYNLSIETVNRNAHYLDLMATGEVLEMRSKAPRRLMNRLYEALAAARKHGRYTDVHVKLSLRSWGVLVTPREPLMESVGIAPLQIETPSNEFEVVELAEQHANRDILFTNFTGKVHILERWAKNKNRKIDPGPPLRVLANDN